MWLKGNCNVMYLLRNLNVVQVTQSEKLCGARLIKRKNQCGCKETEMLYMFF